MIPKIIHYVWFGDVVPAKWQLEVEHCQSLHPDFDVRLHMNPEGDDMPAALKSRYQGNPSIVQKSDIIRAWLVWQHGGVYIDIDTVMIRPIDDLLEMGAFTLKRAGRRLNVAVFGATPQHPFVARWIKAIETARLDGRTAAGNVIVRQLNMAPGGGIRVLPRPYFEPFTTKNSAVSVMACDRKQQGKFALRHGQAAGNFIPYGVHIGMGTEPTNSTVRRRRRRRKGIIRGIIRRRRRRRAKHK